MPWCGPFLLQQQIAHHVVKLFSGHFLCLLSPKETEETNRRPWYIFSPIKKGRKPKMIGSGLAIYLFGGKLRQKILQTRASDLSFLILWRTQTIAAGRGKAG